MLFCSLLSFNSIAKQPHTIYFLEDFRPYIYLDKNQQPAGLMAEIVLKTLEESGVEYRLVPNNVNRLMMEIKKGGNVSTFGVYKTAERESWSILKPEIYRAPQPVLVIKKSKLAKLPYPLTIDSFSNELANNNLSGVLIENYSYGNILDNVFATKFSQVQRFQLDIEQAFKMVASPHRADFTLAYPAQARFLIEQDPMFDKELTLLPFTQLPANDRAAYWMFSEDSDPNFIKKIESAMLKVKHTDFYRDTIRKYTE